MKVREALELLNKMDLDEDFPNLIDPVGKIVHHKNLGYSGRVISYRNDEFTIMVFGCDGFYTDKIENWMITSL